MATYLNPLSYVPKEAIEAAARSFVKGFVDELNTSRILSKETIATLMNNLLSGAKDGIDKFTKPLPPLKGASFPKISSFLKTLPSKNISVNDVGASEKLANLFGDEFNSGYKAFTKKVQIGSKIEGLFDELTPKTTAAINTVIEESIKKTRESISKESEQLFRELTLSALPWIALTGAVAIGVPLLVLYVYHRAKRNLDCEKKHRPFLQSQELRHLRSI
jgi:hypothetical protein